MVWDEVMHYVDPEMDIGSYAITRASNPVCLGSEALGSRNLGSEALGNGRSGSGYCNRVQRQAT